MEDSCGLSIGKNIEVRFKNDGRAVILKKDKVDRQIVCLDRTLLWLEEIPQKIVVRDIIKLGAFYLLPSDKVYFIEEILIDMENDKYLKTLLGLSKEMPVRLCGDVYKYRDLDNKLCLLNLRTNSLIRIENDIRNKFKSIGLEVTSVKLNKLENNSDICELVIELGSLEIIHIVLKIDSRIDCGYEVNNTIYSEYFNGLEFNVSGKFKTNEFISEDIFFASLIKHQLCAFELHKVSRNKILDDKRNVKTNIKVKIMANKMYKKEND